MAIEFEKVVHIYGQNSPFEYLALNEVDLRIEKGSFTAIIGHTGSGKSTLVQHINALLLPTAGKVIVEDYKINAHEKTGPLKPLRKLVGLVFQFPEYQLFEETIEKDIIFGPKNFGIEEETAKQKAKEALKLVGLDESYLSRSPFDLSGGQKRRVAIAGILAMEPEILIVDEPTAGLDPQGSKEIMGLFKKLHNEGKTIIIVTHDMDHVLEYCDKAIVMNMGKIVLHEDVKEVFRRNQELADLSIQLPLITSFINDLNSKGFTIDPSLKDIKDLVKAIGGK